MAWADPARIRTNSYRRLIPRSHYSASSLCREMVATMTMIPLPFGTTIYSCRRDKNHCSSGQGIESSRNLVTLSFHKTPERNGGSLSAEDHLMPMPMSAYCRKMPMFVVTVTDVSPRNLPVHGIEWLDVKQVEPTTTVSQPNSEAASSVVREAYS